MKTSIKQYDEDKNSSNIIQFANFCNSIDLKFNFFELLKNIKINGERKSRCPTESVAFTFFTTIWGAYGSIKAGEQAVSHLMSIDKAKYFAPFLDSFTIREVCYETLRKYLRKFRLSTLREVHSQVIEGLETYNAFAHPKFKNLRIAAIDGTHMLNEMYICGLALLGEKPFYYDFATYTKGKEIPAAKRLLKDFFKHKISTCIDVLLMDALYLTNDIIKLLCNKGKQFVIRIRAPEEGNKYSSRRVFRKIINQAQRDIRRFKQGRKLKYSKSIYIIEVIDKERNREYKVYVVKGLSFAGEEVTICYVIPLSKFIDKYREIRAEKFFIVTNIDSVKTAVLLAAERSQIEELYDITKNEFNIKYDFVYDKDFAAFRRLFMMVMTAINMIMWYTWWLSKKRKRRINLRETIRCLRNGFQEFSLCLEYYFKPGRLRQSLQEALKILRLFTKCQGSSQIPKIKDFTLEFFSALL